MPRKYTKRSEYWESIKKKEAPIEDLLKSQAEEEYLPQLIGESIYTSSEASRLNEPTARTDVRTNRVARSGVGGKFDNI